eukprot:gene3899-5589_t
MKKLLLVAFVAAAGWWYFIGGRTLSEAQVIDFYRDVEKATLERKPGDLCNLLADDFSATGAVALAGVSKTESQTRSETCDGYRALYAAWDQLGEKMGGTLQLDSKYEIHSIALSADKKSATVDISSSLDVAGTITNIRARSTETLVRRNGN